MDGTTAGNGPGPRTMFPVVKNVMLASADQVAIDAVAAKMMGFDPMSHRVHPRSPTRTASASATRATSRSSATPTLANEIVGLPRRRQRRSRGGDLIWFGPLKRFQKLFFHTPLVQRLHPRVARSTTTTTAGR